MKIKIRDLTENHFFYLALLIVFVLVLYAPTLKDFFLSDDLVFIHHSYDISSSAALKKVFTETPIGNFYRPIIDLSFFVDYQLWHLNPVGYHLTNIFFHLLNVSFLYWLTFKFFKIKGLSFLISLLFAVYPAFHENVSWLSGRSDLIPAFFILATLLSFYIFLEKQKSRYLLFSFITFFLALLSKESSLTLIIALILVYLFFFYRRISLKTFWYYIPHILIIIIYFIIRKNILGTYLGGYSMFGQNLGFGLSLENIRSYFLFPLNLWKYSVNAVYLNALNFKYITAFRNLWVNQAQIMILCLITILLAINFSVIKKHWSKILFGYLLSLTLTLPMFGLLKYVGSDLQNTRYFYLPSMGIFIALAVLLYHGCSGKKLFFKIINFIALMIVVSFSVGLLKFNYQPWENASKITKYVYEDLKNISAKGKSEILFNDIPDNLNGAFVLRRGLGELTKLAYDNDEISIQQTGRSINPSFATCDFKAHDWSDTMILQWDNQKNKLVDRSGLIEEWQNIASISQKNKNQLEAIDTNILDWQKGDGIKLLEENNTFKVQTSSKNNYFITPVLDLPALALNKIVIEIKDVTNSGVGSIYWTTHDKPSFNEYERHIFFPVVKGGDKIQIDLCRYLNWLMSGIIKNIRIDLINSPVKMEVKGIFFD